jgi:hypothetical protein
VPPVLRSHMGGMERIAPAADGKTD